MTTGLLGTGLVNDPWLIGTKAEMATVLRDNASTGFYRVTRDLYQSDSAPIQLTALVTSAGSAAGYAPKVIDLNGFELYAAMAYSVASGSAAFISTIHFKNGVIRFYTTISASGTIIYALYRCFVTDCSIRAQSYGTASTTYLFFSEDSHPALITREIRRVVITNLDNASVALTNYYRTYITTTGFTISDAYMFTSASGMEPRFTKRSTNITLASLPAIFATNGWWEAASLLYPYQIESVALSLSTLDGGSAVSRMVWLENNRQLILLGLTDVSGVAEFTARVLKNTGFTLYASEDLVAAPIRGGAAIVAGGWYVPPVQNAYVYQASAAGTLGDLTGVVFAGSPVVVSGITFTPFQRRLPAISDRLTVAAFGSAISRTLDNATGGGGGPVIDGDPAYLDGVVEEIHPMLGTLRALVNAEVVVFEKRVTGYVAMGSAYSNAVGEFRVNTEVYGGGDIFAFAADFPGVIWQAGIELNTGDRVRPTVNNGYVYEIVTAGNSGATEPSWWADTGDGTEGAIGGATAKARPYYQPVGHGPLKMTFVE